ncbi:MAG: hypothetical protein UY92_C0010G0024 [Candidatus Magasanikbacteria bacterium GW2011_GWA2_56_11]|uniref:Uncharacterized protein n=1 Tax=Candidatus Magasanikbacteria bacterium GW2011_GWA2_56_11 TaxID=1619044 RepID=A0A0G1YFA6_9BACT|nr:MAG: hypothetical protein UY92_C0010G0024 [Candidatus Magasanikbacteria bacterium GW2011_GWA2_56_11]
MAHKETLITWLNDAYSVEQSYAQMLERHRQEAKDMPEVSSKIDELIASARRHAEEDKECIERLGGDVSRLKKAMASLMGTVGGAINRPGKDAVIQNALEEYAVEQLEIASYRALVTAAEKVGEMEVAAKCREILQEEEQAASWLQGKIPQLVEEHMERAAAM